MCYTSSATELRPNPAVNSDAPFRASFLSVSTGALVTLFR